MKRLSRKLPLALGVVLLLACTALFSGCGQKMPEAMTEDAVAKAAADTLTLLHEEDYDAIIASMSAEMQKSITADKLREVWEPYRSEKGAYVSTESTAVTGHNTYATAVVKEIYENGSVIFTLSYYPDYSLSGFYLK